MSSVFSKLGQQMPIPQNDYPKAIRYHKNMYVMTQLFLTCFHSASFSISYHKGSPLFITISADQPSLPEAAIGIYLLLRRGVHRCFLQAASKLAETIFMASMAIFCLSINAGFGSKLFPNQLSMAQTFRSQKRNEPSSWCLGREAVVTWVHIPFCFTSLESPWVLWTLWGWARELRDGHLDWSTSVQNLGQQDQWDVIYIDSLSICWFMNDLLWFANICVTQQTWGHNKFQLQRIFTIFTCPHLLILISFEVKKKCT